jgi:D-sedoheptulose 7-phosphate isomerase
MAFLERVGRELARVDPREVQALGDAVFAAYKRRRFVFVIGNGGSGSNASHFCEDAGKCTIRREDFDNDAKPRLRVLSLTDCTPYITAWANDEGYERVYAEQLKNLASPGDLLIAISGSGNSPNILRAVEWANRNDLTTFGLTGYSGGKLRTLAQQNLHVPLDDMGVVETVHLAAFHWVVGDLARRMNA